MRRSDRSSTHFYLATIHPVFQTCELANGLCCCCIFLFRFSLVFCDDFLNISLLKLREESSSFTFGRPDLLSFRRGASALLASKAAAIALESFLDVLF